MNYGNINEQREEESIRTDTGVSRVGHYYGDYVRVLFFAIGFMMLLCLPFFSAQVKVGPFLSILGIIVINFLAGLTNPKQKIMIVFDAVVALIGTTFFGLFAYFQFKTFGTIFDAYFWFNEIVALLFFVALYLNVKTLRGMMLTK